MENRYPILEQELDRILRAELNSRVSSSLKPAKVSRINEILERKNRQIVEAHQESRTETILPSIFSVFLQLKEGGRLFLTPEGLGEKTLQQYINKKERFNTLFSAALMAIQDPQLNVLVTEKRMLFDNEFIKLQEMVRLIAAVGRIKREADMSIAVNPGLEESAINYLKELAPLRSDLGAIEARAIEFKNEAYMQEGFRKLRQAIHSAGKSIAGKEKKAAEFLFSQAGIIFSTYKATPADLSYIQAFMEQKEELSRYAKIFDSLQDEDRRNRILQFIATLDVTLQKLQREIEKQKAEEARASEKSRREVDDAFTRFQEIKEMFARGELAAESQQKNTARKLENFRDIFKAHGQRIMARDVERFMNSTGIGKSNLPEAVSNPPKTDTFDYRKGFLILLPVSIALLLLVFMLILL
jgi:hypothetical protein